MNESANCIPQIFLFLSVCKISKIVQQINQNRRRESTKLEIIHQVMSEIISINDHKHRQKNEKKKTF